MNNLAYAIIIVMMLVLGFIGIIAGYMFRIMSYPYANLILTVSTVMFIFAVLLPLFLSNSKEKNTMNEDILDSEI